MTLKETIWFYILPFIIPFLLSHFFIWLVRRFAIKKRVMDVANLSRKISRPPVPLLGGVALFFTFIITLIFFYLLGWLTDGKMQPIFLFGIVVAVVLLVIGGALDDKYNLKPNRQIWWPILACLMILIVGIKVNYVTNPFGGVFYLDQYKFTINKINFFPVAQIIGFLWLLGMIYTTKFLDGLDGLVSGITAIGAIIIFIVSLAWDIPHSATSILALMVAGLFSGFLIWNFYPAKIFLGESGATLAGFFLGVLAIISGGKIATALLIMGLPILDVVWVILRRILKDKKSPMQGDRKHLHYRLLDAGLSHSQAVILLYLISTLFGSLALFSNTKDKLILFVGLSFGMFLLGIYLVKNFNKKNV